MRIYKNYDDEIFKTLFNNLNWEQYSGCSDVNRLWEVIHDHIIEILDVMCPLKNILVREERTPRFTNEIYECIKKRKYYVKMFRTSRNDDIYMISKFFRNKCNSLIRRAKSDYIKTSLEANITNPRKYWKILNSMLKSNSGIPLDFEYFNHVTNTTVPCSETPIFLNSYYANVGARKVLNTNCFVDVNVQGEIFNICNVTIDEVKKLISDIDITKDSCVDGVNASILKAAFTVRPNALLHLFNKSLCMGIFPRNWAVGYINVLPKGGDKTNPSNWRPITQTCLPAKMLEKVVQKRLLIQLNRYNILNDGQYGFLAGRSTQRAIFELIYDVHANLNIDNVTGLLFLDISKAFDSLDHKILINKLRKLCLSNNSIKWFESYLDRRQIVRYNGMISKPCKFKYGIPQGSCLGPTLFIFYINELFRHITNVKVLMFADDCVLYQSGNSWGPVRNSLQKALETYVAWGNDHNLSLNIAKTKAMYICSNHKRRELDDHAPFNAGYRTISFVNNFSYLGCIIDNELTTMPEYKAVYRRIEHKIFLLSKLRYFIDKRAALLVYKQAILPYVDYAGFMLTSCNLGCKRDLQILQNNALRTCLRYRMVDHVTVDHLHYEAKLQSLEQRRILQLLKILFACSNDQKYLKVTRNRTRAEVKIVFDIPDKCTSKFLNSPFYRGIKLWNVLPENVQRSVNLVTFSKHVKPLYRVYANLLQ